LTNQQLKGLVMFVRQDNSENENEKCTVQEIFQMVEMCTVISGIWWMQDNDLAERSRPHKANWCPLEFVHRARCLCDHHLCQAINRVTLACGTGINVGMNICRVIRQQALNICRVIRQQAYGFSSVCHLPVVEKSVDMRLAVSCRT